MIVNIKNAIDYMEKQSSDVVLFVSLCAVVSVVGSVLRAKTLGTAIANEG